MELLKDLNTEQEQAVTHGDGPLLIVAGAGTGKTTVITKRLAWLINKKLAKPDEILALTFTDKAAGEIEERVDKLLPYGYTDLWVSTFHSFCQRILERHALAIGVPYDFKVLTETEQWLLVRKNLDRFTLNYYRPLGNPTKFIHALVRHFSRAKDEEIYPEAYLSFAEEKRLAEDTERTKKAKRKKNTEEDESARLEEVAGAYHTYQQLLLEHSALDFGDLIVYALRLFRAHPDTLETYRRQFRYLLVDEFQDTNSAQYELVKLLAGERANLTVVGDDDQAIYRFRGASMSNILQFKKDFPKAKSVVLVTNYRSAQSILDLAYTFICQNNPNRLEDQLSLLNGMTLSKKLRAANKTKGEIMHFNGVSLADEQALIVKKIAELRKKEKVNWGDIAILSRSNDQANEFSSALVRAGIPHHSFSNRGLYRTPVIVDVLSYFRLLDNYHESPSLWRVLSIPAVNVSGEDAIQLSHYAKRKSLSLYQALTSARVVPNLTTATLKSIDELLAQLRRHTEAASSRPPSELLVSALTDIGYTKMVEAAGDEYARVAFSYLNQFYQRIRQWEVTQDDPRLRDFLETIAFEMESGETGAITVDPELGPDVVKLMTVHAAKGLEFPYVFIVGLVDRRFPSTERSEPIVLPDELLKEILPEGDIHLEEERRLFYVAMTRAKQGLYFTSAEDYGGVRKKKLSRFLVELGIPLSPPLSSDGARAFPMATAPEMWPVVFPEPIPEHFSYTALKAFTTCPLQYRYAHVLKVPVWGRHTFSFGQSMHLALERFFERVIAAKAKKQEGLFSDEKQVVKQEGMPTLTDLIAFFDEAWIDEWYPSRKMHDEYYAKGKQSLKTFYKLHDGNWPDTTAVEKGFVLKIGPYTLRGKIDRIDAVEGGIEIIDYKTGRVPASLAEVDKDQLLIYQLAAKKVWHDEPLQLTFYYLNENKPLSFKGSEADLNKLEQKVTETIATIHNGKFPPKPSKHTCGHCDFKAICPFSQA
ncbi:hypothetical protein COV04_03620 [Candidatus Uhrbacteria bacterium CG10_big_fil_rev_8_21_14_0_10_48_11]|uniref:DNA 3'-5' helicase n=1 Tax=Candidatus Uhrbacteria bacterium CG10_big_fil_rev_8_21_14_0_10_48_11 TaxID=1975037 RepID=A0A2M8LDX9_9BACT|nr:MAG: hypothetical protein COV04_03620 [Candidatus Uhrbacteria bacterium CG10_big_fil_rev_8_21_14_0_10_48_11]